VLEAVSPEREFFGGGAISIMLCGKNSEKQRGTASRPAVPSTAEPAAAQDFRQKPDLSR
jgi:hypothetical protein